MGLVAGARHGQGANDVVQLFVEPKMAIGVTGNEGVVHFGCGLGEASHATEGFRVQVNAVRRLRQVIANDQDHANDHSNSEATALLPADRARSGRAKHDRRREVREVLKDHMSLVRDVRGLFHARVSKRGAARVLTARVERSADRVLERFSEREGGELGTLKGLLKTDAVPIAVLGDVSEERSVVKPRNSVNVPG